MARMLSTDKTLKWMQEIVIRDAVRTPNAFLWRQYKGSPS